MNGLVGSGFVASFIGHHPGKALFVGMYAIKGAVRRTRRQMARIRPYVDLMKLVETARGAPKQTPSSQVWFDLARTPFYEHWQGRLVVNWPPPNRRIAGNASRPSAETSIAPG